MKSEEIQKVNFALYEKLKKLVKAVNNFFVFHKKIYKIIYIYALRAYVSKFLYIYIYIYIYNFSPKINGNEKKKIISVKNNIKT